MFDSPTQEKPIRGNHLTRQQYNSIIYLSGQKWRYRSHLCVGRAKEGQQNGCMSIPVATPNLLRQTFKEIITYIQKSALS